MKIKGTAVKTIYDYVKELKPENYQNWLNSMPEGSKVVFKNPIISSHWYELSDALLIPTKHLSEILSVTEEKMSWELGRYSSEKLLKGVYKIFLRVSSPLFVLERAKNVMTTHYNPGTIDVIDKTKNSAVMKFTDFGEQEELVVHRIAGWIEKTIETTGFSRVKVEISKDETGYLISPSWS